MDEETEAVKRDVFVIAFRKLANFTAENIEYYSHPSGGATDEEISALARRLIVQDGFCHVTVAIVYQQFHRDVVKS